MSSHFLQNDQAGYLVADCANATLLGCAAGTDDGQSRPDGPVRCWDVVSVQAAQERLELLLALDVPCEVNVALPSGHGMGGRSITRTERKGGYFSLIGENFSFHVNEGCMEVACVGTTQPAGGRSAELEIRGVDGRLCAKVVCPDAGMAAAWLDVLDSLIYAGKDHSRVRSGVVSEYCRPVATLWSGRTGFAQGAERSSALSRL